MKPCTSLVASLNNVAAATAFVLVLCSPVLAGPINWDGDNPNSNDGGRMSYNNNWYGDTNPDNYGGWVYTNDLFFSYNNQNHTSIDYQYGGAGYRNIGNITFDATYNGSITWTGNGGGLNFNQKLVNNASGTIAISSMNLSGAKNGASTIELNPVNGNITLGGNLYNDNSRPYNVFGNNGKTLTLNTTLGVGSNPAAVSLSVKQNSNVIVNNSQTYTGGTFVEAGTLTLGHASNSLANAGSVSVSGGTLALGSNSDTVGTVTLTSGSITGSGTLTGTSYGVQSGSISAVLGGAAVNLSKTTAGTVTLSNSSTYTGYTEVQAGTLSLGHATNTLPDSSNVYVNNVGSGAILSLGANSDTVGLVFLSNGGQITGTGGTLTGSFYDMREGSVSANLGGAGVVLTKINGGGVTLSGANTYTGGTNVDGGVLNLGHATNTLADTGAISVNGGTLALGANSDTVGAVTLLGGSITGTGMLTGTSYDVRNGTISANLNGAAALTKSTAGTVTLSGTNTYTGTTTVQQGTLTLATTGSIANSATIDIQSGATLDVSAAPSFTVGSSQTLKGNGTIAGSATVNGTLSPGASAGKLTVSSGNLALGTNASTVMEITGTTRGVGGYDAVDISGTIAYEGSLSIPMTGTYVAGTDFNLFDFTGQSGNFDSISLTGSYLGSLSHNAGVWTATIGGTLFTFTNSTGVLNLAAVPEPLTAAGVLLLTSRLLGRRTRAVW